MRRKVVEQVGLGVKIKERRIRRRKGQSGPAREVRVWKEDIERGVG